MSVLPRFIALVLLGSAGMSAHAQIMVTDDLGRSVVLSAPARHVVSLAPSLTESLFAVGAGPQIAAVTSFCNYPEEARILPRVGGMTNPSIETIVSYSPDLIVISMEGNTRTDFGTLTSLGIPVYVSNPRTLEGIYRSLLDLGALTGRPRNARLVVDSLRQREAFLRKAAVPHPVPALFCISLQPLIVAGRNTLLNELMTLAGARNIASDLQGNYPVMSREAILTADPAVLFLTTDIAGGTDNLLSLFPEWSHLNALRQRKVYSLDADIVSRPGPRALQGLELLVARLHGGNQ
jgi:iron complex transport system substrate-binding protein